jgi:hypothetical protein
MVLASNWCGEYARSIASLPSLSIDFPKIETPPIDVITSDGLKSGEALLVADNRPENAVLAKPNETVPNRTPIDFSKTDVPPHRGKKRR